jgi:hypothetical protein
VFELCADDLPEETVFGGAGMVIAEDGLLQRGVLRWLRAACPLLPVVVLTAEPVPVCAGVSTSICVLHKPFDYDDLHALVHQLLAAYRTS